LDRLAAAESLGQPSVSTDKCCWCGKKYPPPGSPLRAPTEDDPALFTADDLAFVDVVPLATFFLIGEQLQAVTTAEEGTNFSFQLESGSWSTKHSQQRSHEREVVELGSNLVVTEGSQKVVLWTSQRGHREAQGRFVIAVARSKEWCESVHCVRVWHSGPAGSPRTPRLQAFGLGAKAEAWLPFGYYTSWGGWLVEADEEKGHAAQSKGLLQRWDMVVGDIQHPVPPFDPNPLGELGLAPLMERANTTGQLFEFDLRHHTTNASAVSVAVSTWKHTGGVAMWYLSDEPDGEGDVEGRAVGKISPAQLEAAYHQIRVADPFHPVSVALNCEQSAQIYMTGADILLLDVYPIGIDTKRARAHYGCSGCDGCLGDVGDVTRRLGQASTRTHGARAVGFVGQAFGGEEHWSRPPTPGELRAMSYLALMHPGGVAGGIRYWLRTTSDDRLIQEAKRLGQEAGRIAEVAASRQAWSVALRGDEEAIVARVWCIPGRLLLALLNTSPDRTVKRIRLRVPSEQLGRWPLGRQAAAWTQLMGVPSTPPPPSGTLEGNIELGAFETRIHEARLGTGECAAGPLPPPPRLTRGEL